MEVKNITPSVKYIGCDDTDLDLFEGQYAILEGISYNSYLIDDEKIAIMDTCDVRKTNEWFDNLEAALAGRTPDYLIVHHMEPDHASNVKAAMDKYPTMKCYCSVKALPMIKRFFEIDFEDRIVTVNEGDTLSLGQHTLTFVMAPMVHWPEVMMSYESSEKILFAADGFGKFGALSTATEGMAEDKLHATVDGWACEARRYYFNIVGKYGAMVQKVLKKASELDIKIICSLHGPIIDQNLDYYIGLYDTWSSYKPENEGVFIAYCSLHGNTEEAALKLAAIIKDNSDVKVSVSDIRRDDLHEAVEDAFRYDRLVLAAPTYDGGVMPIMADFIHHLKIKAYQNRKVAFIENGSWTPMAAKIMRSEMETLKNITIVEPIVTVESTVKEKTVEELKALAQALINN